MNIRLPGPVADAITTLVAAPAVTPPAAGTLPAVGDPADGSADDGDRAYPVAGSQPRHGQRSYAGLVMLAAAVTVIAVWLSSGGPPDTTAVAEGTATAPAGPATVPVTPPPPPVAVRGGQPARASASQHPPQVVVSVVGHVRFPGLKTLPEGSRIADALALAAPYDDADLVTLNAAKKLVDGTQIVVAQRLPAPAAPPPGGSRVTAGDAVAGQPGSAHQPAQVSLASATEQQLSTVPGIGEKTARAIIAYRDSNGPVTDIGQLTAVRGIGDATVARLRDYVVP
ncbi:ComEA family DNA-binding protein [Corynebacterium mendelii]|uniref:ComEA family DNA-binding protein n=1 Tax=Corynebacterium mendelii TaxID=2765362 RepID=A0A939E2A4_9CORY|nr:ComEA family DNA-binding protein [Corynebacterium mendelii]MBN9644187.1 ComEA family DNA-binding protein [Corynebacterium mendelii]